MEDNRNAYSEVIEILKLVDDEKKLEALPMEMLELLKSKSNPEYKPEISKEIPLDQQKLQPETYAILNWITEKYWNEELEQEKNYQINIIEPTEENSTQERVNEEEKVIEKISENIEIIQNKESIENKTPNLPITLENLKWYERIKIKIVELFNKIFKRKISKEAQEGNIL